MFQCVDDIFHACDDDIGAGGQRHFYMFWKPGDGFTDSFALGFDGPAFVASIVLECWSDVPSIDGVRCPCASVVWLFMDEHPASWRAEWRTVEVEVSVYLCVGGESWVDSGSSKEI